LAWQLTTLIYNLIMSTFVKFGDCVRTDLLGLRSLGLRSLGDKRLQGLSKLATTEKVAFGWARPAMQGAGKMLNPAWQGAKNIGAWANKHKLMTGGLAGGTLAGYNYLKNSPPMYNAWNNEQLGYNPYKANFVGYNLSGTRGKNNREAARLDTRMDDFNKTQRMQGKDLRLLGHTYRMNNKPIDIQFPDQLQVISNSHKYKNLDHLPPEYKPKPNEKNTIFDFDRVTLPDIRARQEAISYNHPNISLPKVRVSGGPLSDSYKPYFFPWNYLFGSGTVKLSPMSPLSAADHEHGHYLTRYLRPEAFTTEPLNKIDWKKLLLEEQIANEYGYSLNSKLPTQYRTPENQYNHIIARAIGAYAHHPSSSQKIRNTLFRQLDQGNMLNGEPSSLPVLYQQNAGNIVLSSKYPNLMRGYPTEAFNDKR